MRTSGVLSWLGLLLVGFATGCQSSKPGSSSHAALALTGHSPEAIQAAAVVVFAERGFQLRTSLSTQMVFDRPASTGEKFKHGDWMNEGMLMQLRLRLQDQPNGSTLLRLDEYVVHDPNDALFRSERRIMSLSRSTYRRLLEAVRTRLEETPP